MPDNGFPVGQAWLQYGFSPDGKYFETYDGADIQVFAWDGKNMVLSPRGKINGRGTCTSSGCSGPQLGGIAWDGNGRLYAVFGEQLLVYSVTSSGVEPAAGSPYAVPHAASVSVVAASGN